MRLACLLATITTLYLLGAWMQARQLAGLENAYAHRTKPQPKETVVHRLERAIKHHRYVARHGHGKPRRWHRRALVWTTRELRERIPRIPVGEDQIRQHVDSCLAEIIDRETAGTWNPRIRNYQGSGAYGLPQALPGSKMASAGADWRTNPLTQLRWLRSYVNTRYGGSCQALAHHNSAGWY